MIGARVRIASIAAIGAFVASCGDGEPLMPPERFDTPESVVRALILTEVEWFLLSGSGDGEEEGIEGKLATCLAAATVTACDDGIGTLERRKPRAMAVDSPFSDEPFIVSTQIQDHCLHNFGCGFLGHLEVTGTSRYGCPESQWDGTTCDDTPATGRAITYSGERPRDGDYHVRGEQMTPEGIETFERTDRTVRHHSVDPGDGGWTRMLFPATDAVTVQSFWGHRQLAGGPIHRFRGIRGTPDQPYRFSDTGHHAISFSGALGHTSDTCRIGLFNIETLDAIHLRISDGFRREVQSGELRLNGLHGPARARFEPGKVSVVDAAGHSATYVLGSDALREAIGGCMPSTAADGNDGGSSDPG